MIALSGASISRRIASRSIFPVSIFHGARASLKRASSWPPAVWIFLRSPSSRLGVVLINRFHQHLAVADDLIERSAQRVAELGERFKIVGLERPQERAQLPPVVGQRSFTPAEEDSFMG